MAHAAAIEDGLTAVPVGAPQDIAVDTHGRVIVANPTPVVPAPPFVFDASGNLKVSGATGSAQPPFVFDASGNLKVAPAVTSVVQGGRFMVGEESVVTTVVANTATAYQANQVVGGLTLFPNLLRIAGGSGILASLTLTISTPTNAAFSAYVFETPVTIADHAAPAFGDTDWGTLVDIWDFQTYVPLGVGRAVATVSMSVPVKNREAVAGKNLYAVLVTRDPVTLPLSGVRWTARLSQN